MSDRVPAQGGKWLRPIQSIPRQLAEAVYEGYVEAGHGMQSFDRLHERGGFGLGEIGGWLTEAIDAGLVRVEIVRPSRRSRKGSAGEEQ